MYKVQVHVFECDGMTINCTHVQYEKNTKTFSQENEKDQKQNEKDKKIFSFANNLKTMHLDKYPETGT